MVKLNPYHIDNIINQAKESCFFNFMIHGYVPPSGRMVFPIIKDPATDINKSGKLPNEPDFETMVITFQARGARWGKGYTG
jgi:hypothetical protein